ncbi:MAG: hypothetical protein ACKOI0_00105, partial [Actinomycetota bacterium]
SCFRGRSGAVGSPSGGRAGRRVRPDHREVRTERLYVKVPGSDKLRRTAAARLQHLLADGWREIERTSKVDHVQVTFERMGPIPLRLRLPKGPQVEERPERRRSGFGRGPGGPGGPGGPRGRR